MATVAQIMNKSPKSVGPSTSIRGAAKKMRDLRVGALLIKRGKNHVGIVTDTDVVRKALAGNKDLGKLTVDKIMSTPLCTIESNSSVDDAQDMMGDLGVRHLAVTKGGSVVGVVSVRDLLLFYKRYAQSKISTNQGYSEPKIGQD
ncbi:CBS domain-containing protein [Nitrospirales bacterium NOB]|nr:MAG: signal-transduction protein with CBS domain protein [Nitrospira sp. OLB3]MBV6469248.1 Hypoxic response protein 1 [Nitrospirota bacterium]MCE7964788.1 CBS domain-containing protein [Nitrospira sp. NTP2]MCK6492538.1 CBS domain-containing protein [Nitrospira sp.]MDL1889077.1 CBS domain-containing protein [Nitrospirales bacterium NOB]MEB2337792.1 CBS domain-containing protein [Nitrospirales bacterium]